MRGLLAVAVLMMGCGAAVVTPGDACDAGAAPACVSAAEVAYCEGGTWRAFACAGGCSADGGCDWRGSFEGVACPALAPPEIGRWGLCESSTSLLLCHADGGWERRPCGTCEATSSNIACRG